MNKFIFIVICVALFTGAACFLSLRAFAGSCCGGGGGAALVLPTIYQSMVDVSFDSEKYVGYWSPQGQYVYAPVGYQYRLNAGYALRLAQYWQASISVPYVWNNNQYSNGSTRSSGIGDTTLNLWYEALEDESAWKIRSMEDLTPSVMIGPSILIPTGISPYDNKPSSYDITGRGFYRFDGNVLITKTLHPWTASVSLAYGTYLQRPVNREYGKYVEPYEKKLGDRSSASVSLGYIYYIGSAGDTLTGTVSLSTLREENATINGKSQPDSGFQKDSYGATIAYSSTDSDWTIRVSCNNAIKSDGWGKNFPATNIYTIGVSYGFR
ncbi:MAG TPA: hypothetical protein VL087_07265 [Nitrospirota bacterium]|nr:hypothetical protein [Nitrospirota bacterium]